LAVLAALGFHAVQAQENKVLAKVGSETITEADLKEMANAAPERFRQLYMTPEGQQRTLEYVVNIFVLAAEAEKQGMDKAPGVKRLIDFTKKDLLARLYLDKMSQGLAAPTDAEALAFYEANRSQYSVPESVHLHHILVQEEKDAKDVLARLKKGEKFADIATQISICPSKVKGGDLDWLPRGSLVPEIEDVVFKMTEGQTQGPVKSRYGFHVLFLEQKKAPQETPFEQVKDYIVEQLKFQKQQENYDKLAEALRKQMNVQVLATPPAPTETGAPAPAAPGATPPAAPAGPAK